MTGAYEFNAHRRDIALMLSTAACIGIALGLFPGLIALAVEMRGFDTSWNGALAAMPAVAGILVGPFVPRFIAEIGSLHLFLLATGLAATGACLFPYFSDIAVWFLIRFAMGVGMGIQWGPLPVFTGGCAAAIYTAGLAGINDAFSAAEMPSSTSVFSMFWYVGGLSGPAAAGYAVDLWDRFGMAAVVAIVCASVTAMGVTILLRAR